MNATPKSESIATLICIPHSGILTCVWGGKCTVGVWKGGLNKEDAELGKTPEFMSRIIKQVEVYVGRCREGRKKKKHCTRFKPFTRIWSTGCRF